MATAKQLLDADSLIRNSIEALGEAIGSIPTYSPPALARAVQAEHNLQLQVAGEFGLLSSTEAGLRLGSRSRTPRNLASSMRRTGRLLALQRRQSAYFPGFQFDDQGQPLLVIRQLRKLAEECGWSEPGITQWLMGPTTYLDDQRPVDLLRSAPESVLAAARASWDVTW